MRFNHKRKIIKKKIKKKTLFSLQWLGYNCFAIHKIAIHNAERLINDNFSCYDKRTKYVEI